MMLIATMPAVMTINPSITRIEPTKNMAASAMVIMRSPGQVGCDASFP
jgi:hypothetical protein